MKSKLNRETTVTDEMMSLRGLLEKSATANVLREMISFGTERLMDGSRCPHGGTTPPTVNPSFAAVH